MSKFKFVKKKLTPLYVVYCLIDPLTKEVRYIGCCLQSRLSVRYSQHLSDVNASLTCNKAKATWTASLKGQKLRPSLKVLENRVVNWEDRERYWIKTYLESGAKLTNLTLGGKGPLGYVKSEQTKLKHRQFKHTVNTAKKISQGLKGKKKTESHKTNLSISKAGKPWTEIQRAVLTEVWKRNPQSKARYRKGESNGNAVLTEDLVRQIRKLKGKFSISKIAEKFGVCYSAAKRVLSNKTWSHVK